jgi:hypothetical protein
MTANIHHLSENRVLRIFEPKREEVSGGWGRLHNQLHNLCTSPNTVWMFKKRRVRWVGHVAHLGEMRNAYKILSDSLKGRDHLEDLGMDGKIIFEWILEK